MVMPLKCGRLAGVPQKALRAVDRAGHDAAMPPSNVPQVLTDALRRMGLAVPEAPLGEPLTGGVSSDIWRVDLADGPVVVKRPLARLRVAADWRAPVGRSRFEAAWLEAAARHVPEFAPALRGFDADSGALAMAWLDPATHLLWKTELRAGRADPLVASAVGERLIRLHARMAAEPRTGAAAFRSASVFYAIRLAPYFLATAEAHPDVAGPLNDLVARTESTRLTLVHGDVSPKNILLGPGGPVLVDAECATWGDPAFDLAFVLTHLLLKCVWVPHAKEAFLSCFDALSSAYLTGVTWEGGSLLEARAATLLPGLLLARIDGKSPVEYVTSEADRDRVRGAARALLTAPVERLAAVRDAWRREMT